mgnify:CR=1 FL=1
MKTEIFTYLPVEARKIRETVFIIEQGFENEYDETDLVATHILIYIDDGTPVGTCRIFWDTELNSHILGRLAVLKEHRSKGFGAELVRAALSLVADKGGSVLTLHAQCRSKAFYEKLGFSEFGEIEYDEGCPHIKMKKYITKNGEV